MFDKYIQMKVMKHFKINLMFVALGGAMFATESSKFGNNIEKSISNNKPSVSQVLAQDTSGLTLALSMNNHDSITDVPEWAEKLKSDVEDIKKTQQQILTCLQVNNFLQFKPSSSSRRRSSDSFFWNSLRAEEIWKARSQEQNPSERRVSFTEFPMRTSIDLGDSIEMTEEEKEADKVNQINNRNQNKANHRKDLIKMRLVAKNSFLSAHPNGVYEGDAFDPESDEETNEQSTLNTSCRRGGIVCTPATKLRIASIVTPHPPSPANSSTKRPTFMDTTSPLWLKNVSFTEDAPVVIESTNLSATASMDSLSSPTDSLPLLKINKK